MIPYPGDWHLLKNYQLPLMKAYFHGGLKALAQRCGYPLASIETCGQFKRTHLFIMEAWEAIYKVMLTFFLKTLPASHILSQTVFLKQIRESLNHTTTNSHSLLQYALLQTEENRSFFFLEFKMFLQKMDTENQTWRFWIQFVFKDALAYVSLYCAIRSANWSLRVASIKEMAAVFTAFDHQTYQRVITQHLCNIVLMPQSIITMFNQGAFVVNVCGSPWHAVAIDEAHEMLINKSCKLCIVKPNPDYISRTVHNSSK